MNPLSLVSVSLMKHDEIQRELECDFKIRGVNYFDEIEEPASEPPSRWERLKNMIFQRKHSAR